MEEEAEDDTKEKAEAAVEAQLRQGSVGNQHTERPGRRSTADGRSRRKRKITAQRLRESGGRAELK